MQPAPPPVLNFFARFVADPESIGVRNFHIALLDLEVTRADYNVLCDLPLVAPSDLYKSDIARARHALDRARENTRLDESDLDLRYNWLTLLGNRLATERGLHVEGVTTLALVTSERLDLPLRDTEVWSEGRLFRRYTETVLRDEWDYPGGQFRYSRRAVATEEKQDP